MLTTAQPYPARLVPTLVIVTTTIMPVRKTKEPRKPSSRASTSKAEMREAGCYHLKAEQAFDWILESKSYRSRRQIKASQDILQKWLSPDCENQVFWITGKPGSGKTTLVKSIRDHWQLRSLLKAWANAEDPIVVEHFFWIAGNAMQRSFLGFSGSPPWYTFRAHVGERLGQAKGNLRPPLARKKPWPTMELS